MEYTVIGFTPFSGEAKAICELQEQIFRVSGNSAGLALPPLIPLCYLPPGYNRNAVKQILQENKWKPELVTGDIKQKEQYLYLPVTTCGEGGEDSFSLWINTLRRKLLESYRPRLSGGAAPPEPLPLLPGFFLGINPSPAPGSGGQASPSLPLRSLRLELLLIRSHSPLATWWTNMEWESLVSVKCKFTRSRSPHN